ncbi:hypothetical protein KP509_11G005800 [Ceratopteris richardii]|uniref:Myb-like domain-containing protein n=1 Tax=Ceratopteris richardii TaxID=49495 RepID=A0A8T2TM17_CERRI|nr:hypothetical protein KP509_11G005800 [Ceratopteris richardii]
MMSCGSIDLDVAGEDLPMLAMEDSTVVNGNGSDGSFMFATVPITSDDGSTQPQWSREENPGASGDGVDGTYLTHMISEEKSRVGRQPRWTRDETLVLIEGKRLEEVKWSKVKENRERGIEIGRANSDSKWFSISLFCDRKGVSRSAAQCRKRWCNLSADYKRIRDWETLRGKQSFWLMSNDVRKENKLPGCFDREVYDALNKTLGLQPSSLPDMIFDSGRQSADDGLFSDIEHPLIDESFCLSAEKEMDSPPIESLTSAQGHYEEKFINGEFSMDGCEDAFELEPDILPGRKKRKRPSVEECDEFNKELCTLLESSSKILTAHVETQNLNFHLDRAQRKEHAESLVSVLGKLADAVGRIADKL